MELPDLSPDHPLRRLPNVLGRLASQSPSPPNAVTIHPTDICNQGCPWCWFSRGPRNLDLDKAFATLDSIKGLLTRITVSGGGEPLAYPQARELFGKLAALGGVQRKLYTNGLLLPRYLDAVLVSLDYVRVSLDATDEPTYRSLHGGARGDFWRILRSVGNLADGGMDVGLSFIVHDDSKGVEERATALARDVGAKRVLLKPRMVGMYASTEVAVSSRADLSDMVVARKGIPATFGSFSKLPIPLATSAVTITADGGLYPCCHLTGHDYLIGAVGQSYDEIMLKRHYEVGSLFQKNVHNCHPFEAWASSLEIRPVTAHQLVTLTQDCEAMQLPEFVLRFAALLAASKCRTVGVTGPSAVGKSRLVADLAEELSMLGRESAVVAVDDSLRDEMRSREGFRSEVRQPLAPRDFDPVALYGWVDQLLQGRRVDVSRYVRGYGWRSESLVASHGSVVLLDGLFLDSAEFAGAGQPDVLLHLNSAPAIVAARRRRRDEAVRASGARIVRSSGETEEEIERAAAAFASYRRAPVANCLYLEVDANFEISRCSLAGGAADDRRNGRTPERSTRAISIPTGKDPG